MKKSTSDRKISRLQLLIVYVNNHSSTAKWKVNNVFRQKTDRFWCYNWYVCKGFFCTSQTVCKGGSLSTVDLRFYCECSFNMSQMGQRAWRRAEYNANFWKSLRKHVVPTSRSFSEMTMRFRTVEVGHDSSSLTCR